MAKYPKPKILLVDMPEGCGELLTSEGYTASEGTFGRACTAQGSARDNRYIVLRNGHLPNVAEQEIVIIDMTLPDHDEQCSGDPVYLGKHPLTAEATPQGAISPRGFSAYGASRAFDRIIKHGGCFIVFAIHTIEYKYTYTDQYGHLQPLSVTNTEFLSVLSLAWSDVDHGEEIIPLELGTDIFDPILEDVQNAEFYCTFSSPDTLKEFCVPLARNKYGQTVAMLIMPDKEERNGWVLLLPQVRDKPRLVLKLLNDVLPLLSPALFPHIEKARWIDCPEYELPHVAELREQIRLLQEEAEVKSAAIKKEIDAEREATSYLRDLITGTGDVLVAAVVVALQKFCFTQVVLD